MKKNSKIDFFSNGLCFFCKASQYDLVEFTHFHLESESAWSKKDGDLQKRIEEILKDYPKEQHQEIIQDHGWELHQYQTRYPSIHRESLVITIFNFLESRLNELCIIISDSVEYKVKLRDLNGKGIERALLYLSKVVGFDFSNMGKELPYIKAVNLLRNTIVHNGGHLPEDPSDRLNKFISQTSNLSGAPGDHVSLSPDFIPEFVGCLAAFFEALDKKVQSFISCHDKN